MYWEEHIGEMRQGSRMFTRGAFGREIEYLSCFAKYQLGGMNGRM